jgi:hypothetical protein
MLDYTMQKKINMTDDKKTTVEKKKGQSLTDKVQIPIQSTQTTPNKEVKNPSEVSSNLKEKPKKKKLTIILLSIAGLILIGISLFYYFGIYKYKPYVKPSEVINLANEYLISEKVAPILPQIPIPKPLEPRTEVSSINGSLFTKSEMSNLKKRRPVAVMINNHAEARPQSGLNSADVVYEALAESGITRFLAIFWSEAPKKVGPIRSARQYYLEWLSPYDPLYIYDGCAETDNPKTDACGNIYKYKIKKIATIGAWRWNDGVRYAPHNEYSSLFSAWEYAKDMNWDSFPDIESWKFKKDARLEDRGTKSKVKITFHERINNGGVYDSVWTYDIKKNIYLKQTGGKPHIDQESNTQLYAKNLILQEVEYSPAYDDKGRIILTTIGEGDATYFLDGKITTGKWKKTARTDRTTYYDKSGNEMIFNRGRIWISAIATSVGKFDIIEQ